MIRTCLAHVILRAECRARCSFRLVPPAAGLCLPTTGPKVCNNCVRPWLWWWHCCWQPAGAGLQPEALSRVANKRGSALTHARVRGRQVILMAGLQGVGKTTACGKLALALQRRNKRVLMVATDVYRCARHRSSCLLRPSPSLHQHCRTLSAIRREQDR